MSRVFLMISVAISGIFLANAKKRYLKVLAGINILVAMYLLFFRG